MIKFIKRDIFPEFIAGYLGLCIWLCIWGYYDYKNNQEIVNQPIREVESHADISNIF